MSKTPEERREYHRFKSREWARANPEKVREHNRLTRLRRGKAAHNEEMRQWRKNNPQGAKSADLRKAYGIGIAEYGAILLKQAGACAICGKPPGSRALAVDHCHDTNKIRGLLCSPCNTAIGLLKENPAVLQNAIRYLANKNERGPPSR